MAVVQRVKEEVIEQQVTSEEEEDQIYLPLSSSRIQRWKPLETEKKLLRTRKRHSAPTHKTKQVVSDDPRKCRSYKKKRAMIDHSSDVRERAEEIRANLATEFPSLVKSMLPSHVTGGFWLGLSKGFCDLHLPRFNTTVVLEDESGVEYKTKYLTEKVGLSGGWRGFSIAHKLIVGDVLVFHLVKPCKFKVYIVRSNSLDEVDGALGLLNLEAHAKQMEFDYAEMDTKTSEKAEENDSEDLGSEVLGSLRFSESVVDFKEVNNIENFTVLVNGLIIDSELSKHVHTKYYELCSSQKSYLHDHLLEGINCKLAAGIISETINISDAIRACKVTTSQNALAIWDQTLKSFQGLGMNVGFLRARLERLLSLSFESERCREASPERVVRVDEEMRTIQAKLLEIRETAIRLDAELEAMKVKSKRIEFMFQEEANAPW